jgi:hypothetical protein
MLKERSDPFSPTVALTDAGRSNFPFLKQNWAGFSAAVGLVSIDFESLHPDMNLPIDTRVDTIT